MLRRKNPDIIEQLAFLSVKYEVYLEDLYQALGLAKEKGNATCEKLSIEYRGTIKNKAIFLIKKDDKIVVQFRVDENLLDRKDLHFESWLNTEKVRKQIAKQNPSLPCLVFIKDLHDGMKKVNLEAEVLEIEKPQIVYTQFGTNVMLTNAMIGDETGKIKLSLWGEQAIIPVEGDIIQITNASIRTYNGQIQLNLGQTGTLTVIQNNNTLTAR